MKKILPLFIAVLLTGCYGNAPVSTLQDSTEASADLPSVESASSVSDENTENNKLENLFNEISQTVSLSPTAFLSEKAILNAYGIDTETLSDYIFAEPAAVDTADTIIIVECKDENDTENIKATFETVLEHKKDELKSYNPEQFDVYDKSIINIKNNAVYWVVSNSAEEITKIIDNNL